MNLEPRLLPVQKTKIGLTQHMKLSFQILQMAAAELNEFIRKQSEDNPFLEMERYADWPGSPGRKQSSSAGRPDRAGMNHRNIPAPTFESLENSILHQLRLKGMSGTPYRIARFLAGNLDEYGYLRISTREAADQLLVPQDEVEDVLEVIQSLEPAGIGARSLSECLLLQLKRDKNADPYAMELVRCHLNDLAAGKLHHIAEALGISLQRVKQLHLQIRTLNPRPVHQTCDGLPPYIVPDAEIREEDGGFVIVLNEHAFPRVTLDAQLANILNERPQRWAEGPSREFLNYYHSAKGLIRALEQRKLTLKRVVAAIAERQRPFLEKGRLHLKPMNMNAISKQLNLHVSTISRAVQNKYVRTPHGLFALKFFFSPGFKTTRGEAVASESIKTRIRDLIRAEDKKNPYSDQAIADLLQKEGVLVSRRTVVKYREAMRIPSSRLRCNRIAES